MKILFVRRRKLGYQTLQGFCQYINDNTNHSATVWHNYEVPPNVDPDLVVRWGCTSTLPDQYRNKPVMNSAKAIHRVSDKSGFVQQMWDHGGLQPDCFFPERFISDMLGDDQWILRPSNHSQGRSLFVVNKDTIDETILSQGLGSSWYLRKYIPKVAEYRVYVVNGKVVKVDSKIPNNTTQVAWNEAVGSRYQNVRWGDWPLEVLDCAVKAHNLSKLHISGVDVMVSPEGIPYILEVNSAPSLGFFNGELSYGQKCMAKAIVCGIEPLSDNNEGGWRKYIHPAM